MKRSLKDSNLHVFRHNSFQDYALITIWVSEQWSWRSESNTQPSDYKSAALPIEPHRHFIQWDYPYLQKAFKQIMFSCHIHYTSQCAHIVSFTVAFFRRLLSLHASQLLDPHHSVYSAEQQRFADHRAESDQHIKVLRDLSVTVLLIAQLRY